MTASDQSSNDTQSAAGGCGCHSGQSSHLGTPDVGAAGAAPTPGADSDNTGGCCQDSAPTPADEREESAAPAGDEAQESTCCGSSASAETAEPSDAESATPSEADTEGASGCCGGGAEQEEPDVHAQLREAIESSQRLAAEFANYRRRTDRDRSASIAAARTAAVTEFLPVLDDLELAKQHGDLSGPMKAVNDKLLAAFTKLGVEKVGAPGDEFDPEIHEAVQDLSEGDDKVLGTVLRPGYRIGDKLVRTAMVIIADPTS